MNHNFFNRLFSFHLIWQWKEMKNKTNLFEWSAINSVNNGIIKKHRKLALFHRKHIYNFRKFAKSVNNRESIGKKRSGNALHSATLNAFNIRFFNYYYLSGLSPFSLNLFSVVVVVPAEPMNWKRLARATLY